MPLPDEADSCGAEAKVRLAMLHPGGASAVGTAGGGTTVTLPAPSPRPDPESPRPELESSAPVDATPLALDVAALDVTQLDLTPLGEGGRAAPKAPRLATAVARPASPATRRPAPADPNANLVRTRCLAFGGLTAIVAAVATIAAVTLGTPRPPVPVATKIPLPPRYWIARPGQTLISIAAREGISPSAVRRANPALVGGSLESGQRVRLPN